MSNEKVKNTTILSNQKVILVASVPPPYLRLVFNELITSQIPHFKEIPKSSPRFEAPLPFVSIDNLLV